MLRMMKRNGLSGFGAGFSGSDPCVIDSVGSDGTVYFSGDCDAAGTREAMERLKRDNPTAYYQIAAKQALGTLVTPGSMMPPGSEAEPPVVATNPPAPKASRSWLWWSLLALPVVGLVVVAARKKRA